ncbi:hypothetical protein APR12_004875 [Nocardia amikacinitolerans]|nr:hypothetical protein [Nocardia amikacinitolerans]
MQSRLETTSSWMWPEAPLPELSVRAPTVCVALSHYKNSWVVESGIMLA